MARWLRVFDALPEDQGWLPGPRAGNSQVPEHIPPPATPKHMDKIQIVLFLCSLMGLKTLLS